LKATSQAELKATAQTELKATSQAELKATAQTELKSTEQVAKLQKNLFTIPYSFSMDDASESSSDQSVKMIKLPKGSARIDSEGNLRVSIKAIWEQLQKMKNEGNAPAGDDAIIAALLSGKGLTGQLIDGKQLEGFSEEETENESNPSLQNNADLKLQLTTKNQGESGSETVLPVHKSSTDNVEAVVDMNSSVTGAKLSITDVKLSVADAKLFIADDKSSIATPLSDKKLQPETKEKIVTFQPAVKVENSELKNTNREASPAVETNKKSSIPASESGKNVLFQKDSRQNPLRSIPASVMDNKLKTDELKNDNEIIHSRDKIDNAEDQVSPKGRGDVNSKSHTLLPQEPLPIQPKEKENFLHLEKDDAMVQKTTDNKSVDMKSTTPNTDAKIILNENKKAVASESKISAQVEIVDKKAADTFDSIDSLLSSRIKESSPKDDISTLKGFRIDLDPPSLLPESSPKDDISPLKEKSDERNEVKSLHVVKALNEDFDLRAEKTAGFTDESGIVSPKSAAVDEKRGDQSSIILITSADGDQRDGRIMLQIDPDDVPKRDIDKSQLPIIFSTVKAEMEKSEQVEILNNTKAFKALVSEEQIVPQTKEYEEYEGDDEELPNPFFASKDKKGNMNRTPEATEASLQLSRSLESKENRIDAPAKAEPVRTVLDQMNDTQLAPAASRPMVETTSQSPQTVTVTNASPQGMVSAESNSVNQPATTETQGSMAKEYVEQIQKYQEAASQQIVRAVQGSIGSGRSHISFHLVPESLGNITVQLKMESGVLSAHITAQHEQTRVMLEKGISSLRAAFDEQGIRVERLTVVKETTEYRPHADGEKEERQSGRYGKSGAETGGRYGQGAKGEEQRNRQRDFPFWRDRMTTMDYFL
jgi:hypothetical protein